jgi:ABC-type transport system involved in cytochrome bd biosynthesis fused ATPase/permease subunit
MLSLKTTIAALIAAISVIATASAVPALIPQAFAQALDDNNDNGNTVTADQSNSFTADISQSQSQFAYSGNNDNGDTTIKQSADQGFCLQSNQQNVAAGDDAIGNDQVNAIVADDGSKVDCS